MAGEKKRSCRCSMERKKKLSRVGALNGSSSRREGEAGHSTPAAKPLHLYNPRRAVHLHQLREVPGVQPRQQQVAVVLHLQQAEQRRVRLGRPRASGGGLRHRGDPVRSPPSPSFAGAVDDKRRAPAPRNMPERLLLPRRQLVAAAQKGGAGWTNACGYSRRRRRRRPRRTTVVGGSSQQLHSGS